MNFSRDEGGAEGGVLCGNFGSTAETAAVRCADGTVGAMAISTINPQGGQRPEKLAASLSIDLEGTP